MTNEKADYPAAHSMDTDWFAVDANGEVAAFRPFVGGAAPVEWLEQGPTNHHFLDVLVPLLPRDDEGFIIGSGLPSLLETEMHPSFEALSRKEEDGDATGLQAGFWGSLLRLSSPTNVRDILESGDETAGTRDGQYIRFYDEPGVLVYIDWMPRLRLASLMEQGVVRAAGVVRPDDLDLEWIDDWNGLLMASMLGVHLFVEPDGGYSTPMEHLYSPSSALTLGDLPEDARATLGLVRFEQVVFVSSPVLQPVELIRSGVWGPYWTDTDGRCWYIGEQPKKFGHFYIASPDDRGEFEKSE